MAIILYILDAHKLYNGNIEMLDKLEQDMEKNNVIRQKLLEGYEQDNERKFSFVTNFFSRIRKKFSKKLKLPLISTYDYLQTCEESFVQNVEIVQTLKVTLKEKVNETIFQHQRGFLLEALLNDEQADFAKMSSLPKAA